MEIKLKKQPQKYLASVDAKTRKKLYRALEQLSRLEGNIVRLAGYQSRYRYKIDHYRITFDWVKGEIIITVIEINTRSNIKY
ncbi:MAG: addiction module toxin RelE [Clostridiales bacterium]|nr:addiction module toxin RelE [Clostridiales bacterium]